MGKLPLRSINGTKAYTFVVKEGGTLEEFASLFEGTYEQVLALARKKVGSDNWSKIIAADKRNEKRKHQDRREVGKMVVKKDHNVNEEEAMSLPKLKENYSLVGEQIENFRNMADACRAIIAEAEAIIAEEKARIIKENEELAKFLRNVNSLEKEQENLRKQINKLEKTILISPGYKGELPNDGSRMVSTIQYADGVMVEEGQELLKEPSFTEALSFGFSDLKEIALALDFAKLVIRYWMANDAKPFEVLADPNTFKVLKSQGYEP